MIKAKIHTCTNEAWKGKRSIGSDSQADVESYSIYPERDSILTENTPERLKIEGFGTHKKGERSRSGNTSNLEYRDELTIELDSNAIEKIAKVAIENGMIQISKLISAKKLQDLIQASATLSRPQEDLQTVINELLGVTNALSIVPESDYHNKQTQYSFKDGSLEDILSQPIPNAYVYLGRKDHRRIYRELPENAREIINIFWTSLLLIEYFGRDSTSFPEIIRPKLEEIKIETPNGERQICESEVNAILKIYSDEAKNLIKQAKTQTTTSN